MEVKHAIVIILFLAVSYMIWPRKKKAVKSLHWSDLADSDGRVRIRPASVSIFRQHHAFAFVDKIGAFECRPKVTFRQSFEEYCQARSLQYSEALYKQMEDMARSRLPYELQAYI